ncbi:CD1375 family protein [Brevibacillus panacihumi]
MAVIYATLIVKGHKRICDVPTTVRNDTRAILIQLDLPHLAEPVCPGE